MKVLHIGSVGSAGRNIGVVRQLQYERKAAESLGIDWNVELWASDSVSGYDFIKKYSGRVRIKLLDRFKFFLRIVEASKTHDVVLIRYAPADPFLPFLRLFGVRAVLIHHTKEIQALKKFGSPYLRFLYILVEKILGSLSISLCSATVGVTGDILNYEKSRMLFGSEAKPTSVYPNGIDYAEVSVLPDNRVGVIKIAFVASKFFSWHGLEDVLISLANFDDRAGIELHLVGEVLEKERLFIEENDLDMVKLHGVQSQDEMRLILTDCDVGLASFSFDQIGLLEACTLKVREYLASGLPVYSGHIDAGIPDDFPFYRLGRPSIEEILDFATEMRSVDRNSIREDSRVYLNKASLLEKLYQSVIKWKLV